MKTIFKIIYPCIAEENTEMILQFMQTKFVAWQWQATKMNNLYCVSIK